MGEQVSPKRKGSDLRPLLVSMRPRQWIKNLLVVAVPLASGTFLEQGVVGKIIVAFVSMCLAASSVYLVNDVLDRDSDRKHPSKSQRPIASGELPVRTALIAAAVLAVGGLAVAGLLASTDLMWLVAGYLGLQAIYVAWAKHQPVLDLASVAAGFVIRAIAGGVAVGIPTSTWFMTVTAATAFFVVSGKRYSELVTQGVSGTRQGLKDYSEGYLRFAWGVSVGIAVVFYGLWAAELSSGDSGFWGRVSVVPFVLILLRYARDIDAGLAEAPEEMLFRDRVLQILGIVWVAMFALQVYA
ncbi:MAG TPA: decaprenyl-phosphate phosphoribosyltransferase [Actinomycetota bacterium]|nr:decaprenyl-phosphate phosphoribosyltransferase [Actinomycetota bacterium]